LTTYQTVAGDSSTATPPSSAKGKGKKPKTSGSKTGPLAKVKWKRVVADEGHVMKNPMAKSEVNECETPNLSVTKAFAALEAERRWIVTGTPIVNAPNDLGSLLTCLKVCAPLDQHDYFRSLVLRPLKAGSPAGGRLLQAIVGQILLRRTKDSADKDGNKLVTLPPIEYYQCPVKLDPQTRETYDEVMRESIRRFRESMNNGQVCVSFSARVN
jgi:SWI/SNF-related matrix-associated actin-dependent regulator of chromatin subfamily A3